MGANFHLPEAVIDEQVSTLPGLDGRKMSKSYGNTIPLFAPREELRKLVFSILTDSRAPGQAKDTQGSALFQLYQAFATPQESAAFAQAFADGIGWGDAKQQVFERIDQEIAPLRTRYEGLIAEPARIEAILRAGGARLRARYATPLLAELRDAVGLRDLSSQAATAAVHASEKIALPVFKQYRESDGQFYFKLNDGAGALLLQSDGFASPRDAGQVIARLKQAAQASDLQLPGVHAQVDADVVLAAMDALREA